MTIENIVIVGICLALGFGIVWTTMGGKDGKEN
jgi:hypothetical protein